MLSPLYTVDCRHYVARALASCGSSAPVPLEVAVIGSPQTHTSLNLQPSLARGLINAATHQGLLELDSLGQVAPGLADRWIVTDEGKSYIFRLREGTLVNGAAIDTEIVREALLQAIRRTEGTALYLDFEGVRDVRVMTGRVLEIRLFAPMPDFLQILAQPELSLFFPSRAVEENPNLKNSGHVGGGPMRAKWDGRTATLSMIPPDSLDLPQPQNWRKSINELHVEALPAAQAVEYFRDGKIDLILGGTSLDYPLAYTSRFARGGVMLDPVSGLFGFAIAQTNGFLEEAGNREALSMALDRAGLLQELGIGNWAPKTSFMMEGAEGAAEFSWADQPLESRQEEAAKRVFAWRARGGKASLKQGNLTAPVLLRIALPQGVGADTIFAQVQRDWSHIGIAVERVDEGDVNADLHLWDRSAVYAHPRWYLNQFHCSLKESVCSALADELVESAQNSTLPSEAAESLRKAEIALRDSHAFIPFSAPVRWSMVRGLEGKGFDVNRWGLHPLMPLAWLPK